MAIYFYYGDESLITRNKIERLIRDAKIDDYNLSIYDLEEDSIIKAIQDAMTMPFLANNKAVICKNPKFLTSEASLNEDDEELFLKFIEKPTESTYFIIDASGLKLDERKEVVKRLKKLPNAIETRELSDIEINGWIKRQCTINNVNIKDEAIKTFANLVGKNLFNAKNELDKLINYVGPNGVITSDIVKRVVVKEIQNDVYALTNAIIEQDKSKIINIYRDLLNSGNDIYYLFALVSKSMRELYLVDEMLLRGYKQAEIAKALNVSPGRAYHLIKNAKDIDQKLVEEYIIKLGNLDYQIKSGKVDIKSGFELFLFGL